MATDGLPAAPSGTTDKQRPVAAGRFHFIRPSSIRKAWLVSIPVDVPDVQRAAVAKQSDGGRRAAWRCQAPAGPHRIHQDAYATKKRQQARRTPPAPRSGRAGHNHRPRPVACGRRNRRGPFLRWGAFRTAHPPERDARGGRGGRSASADINPWDFFAGGLIWRAGRV